MKKIFFVLFIFLFFLSSFFRVSAASAKEFSLQTYSRNFFNRYSSHFDVHGLVFSVPSYEVENFEKPQTAREWVSLASYYKYRANTPLDFFDTGFRVHHAIVASITEIKNRPAYTLSFHDSEAFFLILRMINSIPDVISEAEKEDILRLLESSIEVGIRAGDTENRSIIAASHWQYLTDFLFYQNKITPEKKVYLDSLILEKIKKGVKESITEDGWYFEIEKTAFSVHYHTISALMLMWYADLTGHAEYLSLAEKMYFNAKKLSFRNGMTESRIGKRPIGLGAQYYLAQALLGKYFGDEDYKVYLFFSSGNRFFSDPKHPDRLEFHSTIEGSEPQFHDDYAFSDVAEIGMTIFAEEEMFSYQYYFKNSNVQSTDSDFTIFNDGRKIVVNNRIFYLGSFGNWTVQK